MLRSLHSKFPKVISRKTIETRYFCSGSDSHDIIIVGGGLIGTTLACTLGKNKRLSDKRILLLEASKKKDWTLLTEDYSNVVSSLSPGTCSLLKSIGVWDHIETARYGLVKKMQVWEGNSEATISFGNDSSNEDVAYIVENNVTLGGVYKELEKLDNVKIVNEAFVKNFKLADEKNQNILTLQDGSVHSSRLLLGCDGWKSKVREKMDVHYLSWNYDQVGIVATLQLKQECENTTAWQRFLPTGPVALLPLNNKLSSLVWSTTPEHSEKLLSLSEEEFVDVLNKSLSQTMKKNFVVEESTKVFDQILKGLNCGGKNRQNPPLISECKKKSRAVFPLGFGHATNYVMQGVALVGDAAHRVHPLAGQGVNLGFGDIVCLNKVLGEAVYSGGELGDLLYLKDYETERQRHNVPSMLAIDGLYRLYGTEFPPVVLLRSLGLQAVDALTPLKDFLKKRASF